jgi:hypothetical protein
MKCQEDEGKHRAISVTRRMVDIGLPPLLGRPQGSPLFGTPPLRTE